jgi:hypothetical protein
MRIAFLTPLPASETPDGGGLSAYLHRMTRSLLDAGHEPEVFVPSDGLSEMENYYGVPIHYISVKENHPILNSLSAASTKIIRVKAWGGLVPWVLQARALAIALERRHAVAPFQLVQSADYLAAGLFVKNRPGRVHVVRCSTAADLYNKASGIRRIYEIGGEYLERLAIRRAEVRYAPSSFVAEHFRRVHKIDVRVVRPPAYFDTSCLPPPTVRLPNRFFLHFGQLTELNGPMLRSCRRKPTTYPTRL